MQKSIIIAALNLNGHEAHGLLNFINV